jgi:hypothetical protein
VISCKGPEVSGPAYSACNYQLLYGLFFFADPWSTRVFRSAVNIAAYVGCHRLTRSTLAYSNYTSHITFLDRSSNVMQQLCSSCRHQSVVCSSSSTPSRPHNHARPQRHTVKHWGRPASKDTPLRRYLRSTLALRDHTVNGGMLALCPALTNCGQEEIAPNISLLNAIAPPDLVGVVATALHDRMLPSSPRQQQ